jgi:D-alanyl-D-alanine dipeptidase
MISRVNLHRRNLLRFIFLFCLVGCPSLLCAQTETPPTTSIIPGPKPGDVPVDWKQLVGIYNVGKSQTIILERNATLFGRDSGGKKEVPLENYNGSRFAVSDIDTFLDAKVERDSFGNVTRIVATSGSFLPEKSNSNRNSRHPNVESVIFSRADAGSDPARFYHVTPVPPVAELREKALNAAPPEEEGAFWSPDLLELARLDPAIRLDIRYATANNFLSTPVYTEARAFLQRPAAEALLRVLHKLEPLGYGLLIHDAYRPWYVTKIFWDATPSEGKIFVADPQKGSKHNRGCAVDLTIYDLQTGKAVEMPGLYDEMSPRSFPNFPGGTSLQRWHRDLLRRAMESEGFTVNEDEWWHFDYKDWKAYQILNLPFEKIAASR